ncbi:lysophospholipid acyltransferase family protein [Methylobrevis pamukkalensis]|uniref:2-acyl-glycerophospho-ethanolamine acyltransferase n=1 Tax=Methylobrevis pamukkalensis TaxID=1439726 RepID=A0A1E3H737_9HYPH|nr:lysophospholipid acyltransferase family protein [Methylobrevis pamukkalensis]ODN72143.1 2-acyl-glycerophospho-ethanolamine acyltransferase [Methylobrevis pamukkalensis]
MSGLRDRGNLLPAAKLALLVVGTLPFVPLQMLAVRRGWALSRRLPLVWHRVAARLLGVRITVRGAPAAERPLLICANHVSWLDIVVLAALMPVSFVAKSEVGTWPVFGTLARLQRSVFVDRQRRSATASQARDIAGRLGAGDAIVLFAEGTSSDGTLVLPFRSALVGAAHAALEAGDHPEVLVQPVAIAYTRIHGLPAGLAGRLEVSWTGEVDLVPHLLFVLRQASIDVSVLFGTPVVFGRGGDRKAVTLAAERAVRRMLAGEIAGHDISAETSDGASGPILKAAETG